jgi:hypothetical protein
MLIAIGDSVCNLASSADGKDVEDIDDEEEDTELGKLSYDDKSCWVMGKISAMVQHRIENFRKLDMRIDKLAQPGLGVAANDFDLRDLKYGMTKLNVPAVMMPKQTRLYPHHQQQYLESLRRVWI